MHILLTGASGRIGSRTLTYLIQTGHSVVAVDLLLPLNPLPDGVTFLQVDLTNYLLVEAIFKDAKPPIEAVIHLGAIPDPVHIDQRLVHNTNVTSSYNVLETAMSYGVRRIVQASSVNAAGLTYSLPGHLRFDMLPMTEETDMRPVRSAFTQYCHHLRLLIPIQGRRVFDLKTVRVRLFWGPICVHSRND